MYFARFLLDFQSLNRLLHLCGMPFSYKRVKWFNQTPDPPQLSTLLQKFTSRLWSAVLSYRAVKSPNRTPIILCRQTTSAYSANTDSYLKDTTDFITLIENTKVPSNAIVVSMDVTSLYTNIPQEEGITLVCQAYETFHDKNPTDSEIHPKTIC